MIQNNIDYPNLNKKTVYKPSLQMITPHQNVVKFSSQLVNHEIGSIHEIGPNHQHISIPHLISYHQITKVLPHHQIQEIPFGSASINSQMFAQPHKIIRNPAINNLIKRGSVYVRT